MATRYGMVKELGFVSYEASQRDFLGQRPGATDARYGPETAERIDAAVRDIIARVHGKVLALLEANRGLLERSAHELLERETLTDWDLARYRDGLRRGPEPMRETA